MPPANVASDGLTLCLLCFILFFLYGFTWLLYAFITVPHGSMWFYEVLYGFFYGLYGCYLVL